MLTNDGSPDKNFFPTSRNDIPQQTTQALQGDAYSNYQPAVPGRTTDVGAGRAGFVTIHESNGDIIYAAPGSVVYEGRGNGDRFAQVGGGQNGYYANAERPSPAQWAPPGLPARPYYEGYGNTNYQNVGSGGWEMPPPYRPNPVGEVIGGVLGALGGAFLFGGRHHGYEPYRPYFPPPYARQPVFYGHGGGRGFGIAMTALAGAEIGNAVANPGYNYYNQGGYYNQASYYQPQPQQYASNGNFDAYGNPIG